MATFKNVLVSGDTPYTLEEVNVDGRYLVPKTQKIAIEWNKVIEKGFDNIKFMYQRIM